MCKIRRCEGACSFEGRVKQLELGVGRISSAGPFILICRSAREHGVVRGEEAQS